MSEKITIVIGGDTVPTSSNQEFLINGLEKMIFNNVADMLKSSDFSIVNLECPLTDNNEKINKIGPCLKAKPETIKGLISSGINVYSLANNHVLDFGKAGLDDTIKVLTENSVFHVGAGKNLVDARNILYLEKDNITTAIISVAEHEFSIAENISPGANPYDPHNIVEDILIAKENSNFIIILYHGGIEHYQFPSPDLQNNCRKMVEYGASIVVCQHSHCIGTFEKYLNSHIFYGQGNLLFDYFDSEMWKSGLLIKITFENNNYEIEFHPVVKKGQSIDLAKESEKNKILKSFYDRSAKVNDEFFIQKSWSEFSEKRKFFYFQSFLGFGSLYNRIDNRVGNFFTKLIYNRKKCTLLYNFIFCQSHLEVVKTILKDNSQIMQKE